MRGREIVTRGGGRWKKEEQGFSIDVIVSVRHPSHSSFLRARPRASTPSALPRRAAPTENYPLQRGACHSSYFFISPLFLFPRSSTHRLQYYHLPLFQACHPPLLRRASLPLFHSERRRRHRYGETRPLIYTCTSDHNINFNDSRDENIRTPRYLWRLSWLPSTSFSCVRGHISSPLP